MTITINGREQDLSDGATAAEAVRVLTDAPSGVAVAVNGEVVTRSAWASTRLADGDQVEVLTAVQGG
ncbi:MAG TPA: sulfur carrier protein ThiS [Streptosporangiaceae bacterium]|jgi:sulfur carrier protein